MTQMVVQEMRRMFTPADGADGGAGPAAVAAGRRRAWPGGLWRHRWMALVVGVPTLLSAIYFGGFAADEYVSQARFVIRGAGQKSAQIATLANLVQTTTPGTAHEQASEVVDFLRSRSALAELGGKADLRAAYGHGGDWLGRYPGPFQADTFEGLYRYYTGKVSARIDPESGIAVLEVRAYRAGDAQAINLALLGAGEGLVNRLNQRAEARAIAESERRVALAEQRLARARLALGAYRNAQALIDPARQAGGALDVSNRLEAEQAALAAQLQLMEKAAPANPAIPALRARVAAMAAQAGLQEGRAVGGGGAIAAKLAGYDRLALEQEFATQALAAANTALEQARSDAARQQFYLERVVEPNRPDWPALPHRWRIVLTVLASSLCLYAIGWMFLVGLLEHAPEE